MLSVHVKPAQDFRPIGVLNRFQELRHSKVNSFFLKGRPRRRRHH